jgi:hypothetical protein
LEYTLSFYAKPAGRNFATPYIYGSNGSAKINVDLTNGQIGIADTSVGYRIRHTTWNLQTDGWARVSFTVTVPATSTTAGEGIYLDSGLLIFPTREYVGNGDSGIYIYHQQFSQTNYALPDVETGATPIVRKAINWNKLSDTTTYATKSSVDANTAAIATNTSNIATNTSNIAANTTAITTKQNKLTLTTTGTSGAATLDTTTATLNIPQYSAALADTVYGGHFDAVEGIDLYLYSHSFGVLQSPANISPNRLYQKLLFNRLHFGSLTTRANSGYFAQDVAGVLTNINTLTPGTTGVVILDCAQNDLHYGASGSTMLAANLAGFKNALRAMLWYLRCSSVLQQTDASFTYGGTWTTLTQTWFMGGTLTQTVVNGATATIAVNGTDFVLFSRATGGAQASATVTVDGTAYTTITNPGSQCVTATSTLASTSAPMAIPITGLSAGAHTIVVTNTGGGGGTIFVDAIGTVSTAPPTVLVHKQVYLPDVAYTAWANGANNTTVDVINAAIDAVVAEFPSDNVIKTVNMNANGWDRNTMLHSVNFGNGNTHRINCYHCRTVDKNRAGRFHPRP